jgi:hypothetical protein
MRFLFVSAVVAVVAVLGGCSSNGQIVTRTDPFKGAQRGFALYLDSGRYTAVDMLQDKSGELTMGVLVVQRGVSELRGSAGDKGSFKVGDQTLTVDSTSDVKPVANASMAGVFTQWLPHFKITREQAAAFAAAPLTAVQVAIGAETYSLQLTPSQSEKFRSNMAIMTNAAP